MLGGGGGAAAAPPGCAVATFQLAVTLQCAVDAIVLVATFEKLCVERAPDDLAIALTRHAGRAVER